jgi:hypothetical protein
MTDNTAYYRLWAKKNIEGSSMKFAMIMHPSGDSSPKIIEFYAIYNEQDVL